MQFNSFTQKVTNNWLTSLLVLLESCENFTFHSGEFGLDDQSYLVKMINLFCIATDRTTEMLTITGQE